jgi:hypothetical protein
MTLTVGDIFFKNEWVKKLRLMPLASNSRDTSSRLLVVMIVMDLL